MTPAQKQRLDQLTTELRTYNDSITNAPTAAALRAAREARKRVIAAINSLTQKPNTDETNQKNSSEKHH